MRLEIVTPLQVVVDREGVDYVWAVDESGSFGIQQGHTEFVTVLATSVLGWRSGREEGYVAVARGVLEVVRGGRVRVATRRAELGESLEQLEQRTLEAFRQQVEQEERARSRLRQMQVTMLRRIRGLLGQGGEPTLGQPGDRGESE